MGVWGFRLLLISQAMDFERRIRLRDYVPCADFVNLRNCYSRDGLSYDDGRIGGLSSLVMHSSSLRLFRLSGTTRLCYPYPAQKPISGDPSDVFLVGANIRASQQGVAEKYLLC